jgi:AraC-like DNA-binding protein
MAELPFSTQELPAIFLSPHRKDYYFFALILEGSSRHWVDTQQYTMKPNTFYYTAPPQVHVKEQAMPARGYICCFTDAFLTMQQNESLKKLPIIQNPYGGHEMSLTGEETAQIRDIMCRMLVESRQKDSWHNGMLVAYLQVLLISLSRKYTSMYPPEIIPSRELLKKFNLLVETHYRELHEVAAYAELLHISPGHLGEVIRQQSGKTAIELIHERVLLESRRLLFHTEDAIKEIAFQLGFEDASYFNRFFKRLCGQTPLHFRTSTRKMYH